MTEKATPKDLEWRPEFAVGNPAVDHEHKEMIERINRLLEIIAASEAGDAAMAELGEIYAWISAHFALEETMMREHGYDQLADHKADHERLLDDIRDIMDDCRTGRFDDAGDAFTERMADWFAEHFKTKDARLHGRLGGA